MEPNLITYQHFNQLELADELIGILKNHNIPYNVVEDSFSFDPSFAFNAELSKKYDIKIPADDFLRVNELLRQHAATGLEEVDADYYLLNFTDEELIEILAKPDEWSTFDYVLAEKLLKQRGIVFTPQKIEALNEERLEELSEPDASQRSWIIVGYLCMAIGGIPGIFIGWHLYQHKKTLPDGKQVYAYNDDDRRHGKIIFFLSIATTTAFLLLRVIHGLAIASE